MWERGKGKEGQAGEGRTRGTEVPILALFFHFEPSPKATVAEISHRKLIHIHLDY